MSETRLPLLERDQVPSEIAAVYDALLKQRGVVPNMFKTGRACSVPGFSIRRPSESLAQRQRAARLVQGAGCYAHVGTQQV